MKKKLLCGVQPTNSLTIGNYLGSIKKIIDLQEKYETIVFVADLHARTIPFSYHKFSFKKLEEYKWNLLKMYLACGVDFVKTKIFFQSSIPEHLELFYFLLTHSMLGELKLMTQYKHLSQKLKEPNGTEAALMGLLCYPVLMAADILLYDVDFVAAGKDQEQHIELSSKLANRINNKYNAKIFNIPQIIKDEKYQTSEKIMDLQDPSKKMSKTCDNELGVIFLNDSAEIARNKIMKTKTDSLNKVTLNKEQQPGIHNLLNIYASITSTTLEQSYEKFKNSSYFELKSEIANVVCDLLQKIQIKYKNINIKLLEQALQQSHKSCSVLAKQKINNIYDNI